MKLSKNFSLVEMTKSQTALRRGIDNTPHPAVVEHMERLCTAVLQPVRDHFDRPVTITSLLFAIWCKVREGATASLEKELYTNIY